MIKCYLANIKIFQVHIGKYILAKPHTVLQQKHIALTVGLLLLNVGVVIIMEYRGGR